MWAELQFELLAGVGNDVPGRRLVTAQRFTNALYVGNENGSGKFAAAQVAHTNFLPPLCKLKTTMRASKKKKTKQGWHVITYGLTMGGVHVCLPFYFSTFPSSLPSSSDRFHSESNISQRHSHFVKTPFFFCFVLLFILFFVTKHVQAV